MRNLPMGDDKLIGRWIGCVVLSVRRAVNRCHNHQLNQFAFFFWFKSYSFCFLFFFSFSEKKESGPDQRGGSFSPLSRGEKDETAQKVQHEFFSFPLVAALLVQSIAARRRRSDTKDRL